MVNDKRCDEHYSEIAMERALTDDLKKQYDRVEGDLAYALARGTLRIVGSTQEEEGDPMDPSQAVEEDTIEIKCPLCAGVVLMDTTMVLCSKFNEAVRIQCCFCNNEYCRKCDMPWHEGSCDPVSRLDEAMIAEWTIKCICGARIYRGDGCNKLKCVRCMRSWCYMCGILFKPHESIYTSHYWQPTDRTPNKDLCPLYGERPVGTKLLPTPAPPRAVGRGIAPLSPVYAPVNMGVITGIEFMQQSQPPTLHVANVDDVTDGDYTPVTRRVRPRRANAGKTVGTECGFLTKRAVPCKRKGKDNGLCGLHRKLQ